MSMRDTTIRDEVTPMPPPRERDPYIAWRPPFPEPPFERGHAALLVIDMQYLDAHWDYSMCQKIRAAGFGRELLYYKDRLEVIVPQHPAAARCLPNSQARGHARKNPVHDQRRTRQGPSHKRLGHFA